MMPCSSPLSFESAIGDARAAPAEGHKNGDADAYRPLTQSVNSPLTQSAPRHISHTHSTRTRRHGATNMLAAATYGATGRL